MSKQTNPFKPGDRVRILQPIRDAYGEVWHPAGSVLEVKYLADDGEGLIFYSYLGLHFSQVELVESANRPPMDRDLAKCLYDAVKKFQLSVKASYIQGDDPIYMFSHDAWLKLCQAIEIFDIKITARKITDGSDRKS